LIAREGRLILIKAVITARSIHPLLVENAPVWLLEEVDKWLRAFFWAGKQEVTGRECLVAWGNVCKPICYGGLGVKDLRLQGLALRVRWEWLHKTNASRPWQGLQLPNDPEVVQVFQSLVTIMIGDGKRVLFWKDNWIGGRSAEQIAPAVTCLVPTRRKNSRLVTDALVQNRWMSDLVGNLSNMSYEQCVRLWVEISCITRNEDEPDVFGWKGTKLGVYSAKDTYKMLCMGRCIFNMYELIWRSYAPLKCKIFSWLAWKHRHWTSDRRVRHGKQDHASRVSKRKILWTTS
jgi:hypothetical protein